MTAPVVLCHRWDSADVAAGLMREHHVGALPVVDDRDGRVLGIITDRDICLAAYAQKRPLMDIPVDSAMTAEVFVCEPGDPIDQAEDVMRTHQIRRLPVVDAQSRVVGVLSLDDIAVEAARELSEGHDSPEISPEDITRTLGGICESAGPTR